MNKIIYTILLFGDEFMPELYLKQPGFTYSTCGPFTKHCERTQKVRETGNLKHFYRNELAKACFAHDAPYSDSKDLSKRTTDKILKYNAYEIARNRNYDGYQRALAIIITCKFFDKKTGSGISVIEQLAEELLKPVVKKIQKKKRLCEIQR